MINKVYLRVINPPAGRTSWQPFWSDRINPWFYFEGWTEATPGLSFSQVAEFKNITKGPGYFVVYFYDPSLVGNEWNGYYVNPYPATLILSEDDRWVWDFASGGYLPTGTLTREMGIPTFANFGVADYTKT